MQQYHIKDNTIHQKLNWHTSVKILHIRSEARIFKKLQQNNKNNIQPHQILNQIP